MNFDAKNEDRLSTADYYGLIKRYLLKQYKNLSDKEVKLLCREIIFAPNTYRLQVDGMPAEIMTVRENLADFIEREASVKNFIPYSLGAHIADLIEKSDTETSSVNEFYRWVHVAIDIIQHVSDGVVTRDDAMERRMFISMSYNREAELLLCLALYQGAGEYNNKDKVDLLAFKLAKLQELRHIVFNTSKPTVTSKRAGKEQLRQYYDFCQQLLKQNLRNTSKFRLKLKLKPYDNTKDEDFEDDVFFLEHLRKVIGRMLWHRRKLFLQSQQTDVHSNEITPAELVLMAQSRDVNSR